MSTDGWMVDGNGVQHEMKYYSAIKRKKMLTQAITRMILEDIVLSEISQSQKDKYCTNMLK